MATYFENLIVELDVLYIFKTCVKFHFNQILLIIPSIIFFFGIILDYKNSKFKHLIDDIVTNFFIVLILCKHEGYTKKM